MPHTTHYSLTAYSYARAMIELANERQQTEPIVEELRDLRQIIDTNPTFGLYLEDPAIGEAERAAALDKIFRGRVSPLLFDFLQLLNHKGRLGLLCEIVGAYEELLEAQLSRVEVDVTVAQRLDDAQLEDVRQRVGKALKKEAVVHQYVDELILGGLILRVQDQLIDGSVRFQLHSIRQRMLEARPR